MILLIMACNSALMGLREQQPKRFTAAVQLIMAPRCGEQKKHTLASCLAQRSKLRKCRTMCISSRASLAALFALCGELDDKFGGTKGFGLVATCVTMAPDIRHAWHTVSSRSEQLER